VRSIALIGNSAQSMLNFRGDLIGRLSEAGLEVYALAPDYDDETRSRTRALPAIPIDISLDRTGTNFFRDGRDLVRLAWTLRGLQPDASFAYFAKPVIYGSIGAWLARIPRRYAMIEGLGYVFGGDGSGTARQRLLQIVMHLLYRTALSRVHKVVLLNEDDRAHLIQLRATSVERSLTLGGIGVDLSRFNVLPLPQGPPSFLLMARLIREKGIVEFAEAARRVRMDHPQARFLLLGGLDENPHSLTRADIMRWVDEGLIDWPGSVDDVRPWIAQSSVFVLPSYYREGVPRSTQEAMAMGRPVITTDNVGCRDTVEHGVNGLLVPPRNIDALEKAIRYFLEDPGAIVRMGAASRRLAEERFDSRRINDRLIQALELRPTASA
jgi:glycosyltransferase involved in cell wall biosynthesis